MITKIRSFRPTILLSIILMCPVFALASAFEEEPLQKGTPIFKRDGGSPFFDFGGVQADMQSQATQVLVLGSPHLSQLPDGVFNKNYLSDVLDKLYKFSPDIIAIEAVGGRTCDEITRYKELYPGVDVYCANNSSALKALGMTRPQAAAAIETTKDNWPTKPSASDRRRLALLYYGAGEKWSSLLQWAKLNKDERIAKDGVTQELVELFNKGLKSHNENNQIGVELALKLGLDELAMIDDHTADYIYLNSPEELWPTVQSVWKKEHPRDKEIRALQKLFWNSAEHVTKGYLFINSEQYQRFVIEKDFGAVAALADKQSGTPRQYLAWWQTRGLRMAANVLEAAGNNPGAKVLVIVGSSHKSYFDLYLDQMHDIELVDLNEVLEP